MLKFSWWKQLAENQVEICANLNNAFYVKLFKFHLIFLVTTPYFYFNYWLTLFLFNISEIHWLTLAFVSDRHYSLEQTT